MARISMVVSDLEIRRRTNSKIKNGASIFVQHFPIVYHAQNLRRNLISAKRRMYISV